MRSDIIQSRKYNPDIAGDELSLKIASYSATARYLAHKLKDHGLTICELCCGIGVSLIELSAMFEKVIGVDNDQSVIDDCKTNLEHAHIANYELLLGDVSAKNILQKIQADVVLYDIPYWSNHNGKINPDKQNPKLDQLVANVRELITSNIVIYTPTHMTYENIRQELGECEYLEIWLNGKHDRNFVFLGSLMQAPGKAKIELND
ncbi:MAG TPA: class I SAM-dependent methyltransferase [Candidatus Saccharimonadales bacterium]|nr:class I SAM-dependent methyltransferase [Candidatus Saccharimonadales bacterium]